MDYDLWKTGYFEGHEDRQSCSDCTEIQQKLDQASEFLEGIRDQIYGKEVFDRETLNFYISELCWLLNTKEPQGTIKVFAANTKDSKLFNFSLNIARQLNPKTNQKTINF